MFLENNGKTKNSKIAFQSNAEHPRTAYTDTLFVSVTLCDLDLDPMTLRYELDLC